MDVKVLSGPSVCLNGYGDAQVFIVGLDLSDNKVIAVRIDGQNSVPEIGTVIDANPKFSMPR